MIKYTTNCGKFPLKIIMIWFYNLCLFHKTQLLGTSFLPAVVQRRTTTVEYNITHAIFSLLFMCFSVSDFGVSFTKGHGGPQIECATVACFNSGRHARPSVCQQGMAGLQENHFKTYHLLSISCQRTAVLTGDLSWGL